MHTTDIVILNKFFWNYFLKCSFIYPFKVFDLVNNENVEETNKLIEAYKKDNNEEIKRNRIKKTQEMEYLEALIREEKSLHARVKKEEDEEKEMLRSQKKDKERLIDELTSSEGGASAIVQQHMANTVTSLQARELGDGMQVRKTFGAIVSKWKFIERNEIFRIQGVVGYTKFL